MSIKLASVVITQPVLYIDHPHISATLSQYEALWRLLMELHIMYNYLITPPPPDEHTLAELSLPISPAPEVDLASQVTTPGVCIGNISFHLNGSEIDTHRC